MKGKERDAIALKYGIPDGRYMMSWLRSLNFIRNVAAHHSRLWNKNVIDQPRIPSPVEMPRFTTLHRNTVAIARPYATFCVMKHFLDHICPTTSWPFRLATVVSEFENIPAISIDDLGFPPSWQNHPVWASGT
jgi:abortive infection bacteriophage resistance protein